MVWGLRLELALQFETSLLVPLTECENQIRLIFRDAHEISFGSPLGLAKRLSRWHPLSAAYLAVHPDPIGELASAQEALVQCLPRPTAWELALEPAYANEVILRSLNLDLVTADFPEATRNPRVRGQIGRLSSRFGQTTWWRPPLSVVPVVFGLTFSAHSDSRGTAYRLLRRYGVAAKTRNSANSGFFRSLSKALDALLEKELSHGAFFEMLPKVLRPLPLSPVKGRGRR